MFNNRYPIIVIYAILLHCIQALALFNDDSSLGVTSIATVYRILGHSQGGTIVTFLAVAGLAAYGLVINRRIATVACMLPQQFILFIAAYGAIDSMVIGQFADGVARPISFLLADQCPAILATIGHTIAILALMEKNTWR